MCGIAGIFLIDQNLNSSLGKLLVTMLEPLSDRGPDSAGVAIYKEANENTTKVTVQSENPADDFLKLSENIKIQTGKNIIIEPVDSHAIIKLDVLDVSIVCDYLKHDTDIRIMSVGKKVEIYKEIGPPREVLERFNVAAMRGTHAIGHTRMATESKVTTLGAHPFSTGNDQCLVHNGSLSNHNNLRRAIEQSGFNFETENDSEVAAAYLTEKMKMGHNLEVALEMSLNDLDGFFTFVVGTENGFGVLRDKIACKPAVMAQTDKYVAFGSEFRALASLPDIEKANVWEPEPGIPYFWGE
ncbi:MAG: glutamine amidotransferase family protein [Pseudomonadota bacterium]|jgi:glutamate synthase domain-containing protein 1|nr:glutamine amidotransferase family protein [Pseudomonadota bacterium]